MYQILHYIFQHLFLILTLVQQQLCYKKLSFSDENNILILQACQCFGLPKNTAISSFNYLNGEGEIQTCLSISVLIISLCFMLLKHHTSLGLVKTFFFFSFVHLFIHSLVHSFLLVLLFSLSLSSFSHSCSFFTV